MFTPVSGWVSQSVSAVIVSDFGDIYRVSRACSAFAFSHYFSLVDRRRVSVVQVTGRRERRISDCHSHLLLISHLLLLVPLLLLLLPFSPSSFVSYHFHPHLTHTHTYQPFTSPSSLPCLPPSLLLSPSPFYPFFASRESSDEEIFCLRIFFLLLGFSLLFFLSLLLLLYLPFF